MLRKQQKQGKDSKAAAFMSAPPNNGAPATRRAPSIKDTLSYELRTFACERRTTLTTKEEQQHFQRPYRIQRYRTCISQRPLRPLAICWIIETKQPKSSGKTKTENKVK